MTNPFFNYRAWAVAAMLASAEQTQAQTPAPTNVTSTAAYLGSLARHGQRDAGVHYPSTIVQCNDESWFFATGMGVSSWRSSALLRWEP